MFQGNILKTGKRLMIPQNTLDKFKLIRNDLLY